MATLPTDADSTPNYTAAQHATHHDTIHGLWNVATTKGDLIVVTGAQAYSRLGVGTDGQVLTADAASTPGVKWAAQSGTSVTFADYTPTLTASTTNPTLGSGSTQLGRYAQTGKFVTGWATVKFGSSGTGGGSGTYFITLPVTPLTSTAERVIGSGIYWTGGGGSVPPITITIPASGTGAQMRAGGAALGSGSGWVAGGEMYISFQYEAA